MFDYKKKSALIIEDFSEFARSVRAMVNKMDINNVDIVSNGEDAIERCKVHKYDIILSDYNLGDKKDGQQLLEELIEFDLMKQNSIFLMLTAENDFTMVMGAIEYQPDSYVTKPFNGNLLKSRIEKAINKKEALMPINMAIKKKKWQQAISQCVEVMDKYPKYRMACLRLEFLCLKQLKQYQQALSLCSNITSERAIPWAIIGIGEIYFLQQEYQKAAQLFSDSINQFPMLLNAYDWLATCQLKQGVPLEAQKTLELALKKSPKALMRQKQLGQVAEVNEDLDTMSKAYRQAIKIGVHSAFRQPDEYFKLTSALSQQIESGDVESPQIVMDEVKKTLATVSNRYQGVESVKLRSCVAKATLCQINGDSAGQKEQLQRANKVYQNLVENLSTEQSLDLAKELQKAGDDNLAEDIMREAIQQNLEDSEFIQKASLIVKNPEIINQGKKASQMNKKAASFFSKKSFKQALESFQEAYQLAPHNININLNLVQTSLKLYQADQKSDQYLQLAQDTLEQIHQLYPEDERYERYSELLRLTQLLQRKYQEGNNGGK